MNRDYTLYLSDIIENITQINIFIGEMTFEQFCLDRKTVYAVIRGFEIIGEATKNIPDDIRALCPTIPWSAMARMRDKCIHAYWGINFQILWKTINEEFPAIHPALENLLHQLKNNKSKEP